MGTVVCWVGVVGDWPEPGITSTPVPDPDTDTEGVLGDVEPEDDDE
jgi:hypothetical protein